MEAKSYRAMQRLSLNPGRGWRKYLGGLQPDPQPENLILLAWTGAGCTLCPDFRDTRSKNPVKMHFVSQI